MSTVKNKRFVALARVSSREQEREGFSLAVQEEALKKYAFQAGGHIVRLFRIAETASKTDERTTFRELISYAKKHSAELDGLLFYKVDRAARNLFDYVELERLESEYGLAFISVSQHTDSNPAGRMMRRTLANMASFYTEQLAVDVREGLAKRVQDGWFVCRAPYGYRNVRTDGRGTVAVDPVEAGNIRRMFHLYAYESLTIDGVIQRLHEEGRTYRPSTPKFARTSMHTMLRDRSYIGEIPYKGNFYPGKHEPLVDRSTWNRVQALLGGHIYHSLDITYSGEFMHCGHCGRAITGERIVKRRKSGEKHYVYYRCSGYLAAGHPRVRVPEAEIERQVMGIFDAMRIDDADVREWFRAVLASQTKDQQADSQSCRAELLRQTTLLTAQQDRLLNMRLADQIEEDAFARKDTELRDRLASIKLQLDVLDRSHDETAELAVKVFELSQTLRDQWLTADHATKRRILEIVCLNCELRGATLCPTMRKPFDVLVEGLFLKESGEGGIRTLETVARLRDFQSRSFSRSDTSPEKDLGRECSPHRADRPLPGDRSACRPSAQAEHAPQLNIRALETRSPPRLLQPSPCYLPFPRIRSAASSPGNAGRACRSTARTQIQSSSRTPAYDGTTHLPINHPAAPPTTTSVGQWASNSTRPTPTSTVSPSITHRSRGYSVARKTLTVAANSVWLLGMDHRSALAPAPVSHACTSVIFPCTLIGYSPHGVRNVVGSLNSGRGRGRPISIFPPVETTCAISSASPRSSSRLRRVGSCNQTISTTTAIAIPCPYCCHANSSRERSPFSEAAARAARSDSARSNGCTAKNPPTITTSGQNHRGNTPGMSESSSESRGCAGSVLTSSFLVPQQQGRYSPSPCPPAPT
jgi:site-specific DNA recombinase